MRTLVGQAKQQLLRKMAATHFNDDFHIKATWSKYEKYEGLIIQRVEVPVKLGYSLYQMYFFKGILVADFYFESEVTIMVLKGSLLMEGQIYGINSSVTITCKTLKNINISSDTHLQMKFTPELDLLTL